MLSAVINKALRKNGTENDKRFVGLLLSSEDRKELCTLLGIDYAEGEANLSGVFKVILTRLVAIHTIEETEVLEIEASK